jgi:hypothetical protein
MDNSRTRGRTFRVAARNEEQKKVDSRVLNSTEAITASIRSIRMTQDQERQFTENLIGALAAVIGRAP